MVGDSLGMERMAGKFSRRLMIMNPSEQKNLTVSVDLTVR